LLPTYVPPVRSPDDVTSDTGKRARRQRSLLGLAVIVVAASGLAGFLLSGILQSESSNGRLSVTPVIAPQFKPDESGDPTPAARPRAVPEYLPAITLTDRDGKATALASFGGRPLLINFWATWCAPCRREIPLLNELRRERSAQGFEVVGIAVDFRDDVLQYVQETRVDYPLLIGEEDGLAAADAFGVGLAFPVSIFADRSGRILALKIGELHRDEADFILDRVAEVDAATLAPDAARKSIASELQKLSEQRAKSSPEPAPPAR